MTDYRDAAKVCVKLVKLTETRPGDHEEDIEARFEIYNQRNERLGYGGANATSIPYSLHDAIAAANEVLKSSDLQVDSAALDDDADLYQWNEFTVEYLRL